MERDKRQMELRSEKVRNIIGQVPPALLRYGIAIIGLSLLVLLGVSAFIPYQPNINTSITVRQDSLGAIHFYANIPEQAIKKQSDFSAIVTDNGAEIPLPGRFKIGSISDTLQLLDNKAWYSAMIYPLDDHLENIIVKNKISIPGKIELKRKSILKWVIGR